MGIAKSGHLPADVGIPGSGRLTHYNDSKDFSELFI